MPPDKQSRLGEGDVESVRRWIMTGAPLAVIADDLSIVYGGTLPTLTD